jgi:hypothetical protein
VVRDGRSADEVIGSYLLSSSSSDRCVSCPSMVARWLSVGWSPEGADDEVTVSLRDLRRPNADRNNTMAHRHEDACTMIQWIGWTGIVVDVVVRVQTWSKDA